jgi:ribonuclease P protein component
MPGSRLPAVSAIQRGSQRLLPGERLRRRADYLRCYRTGRRRQGSLALLYFVPNPLGHPRIGITASRKVGPAFVRHRIKRRIKEIYRRWNERGNLPALDFVIHLKPEARGSDFEALQADLMRLFAGVLSPRRAPTA